MMPETSGAGVVELLLNTARRHLYIRGYAFDSSGSPSLFIRLQENESLPPTRSRLRRADLATRFPGIDANCGFEFHVPADKLDSNQPPVEIVIRARDGVETQLPVRGAAPLTQIAADVAVESAVVNRAEQTVTVAGRLEGDACTFTLGSLTLAGRQLAMAKLTLEPVVPGTKKKPARRGFTVQAPVAQWIDKELFQIWPQAGDDLQVSFSGPKKDYTISGTRTLEAENFLVAVGAIHNVVASRANGFAEIRGAFLGSFQGARVQLRLGGTLLARSARLEKDSTSVPLSLVEGADAGFSDWTWCDALSSKALANKLLRAELVSGSRLIGVAELLVTPELVETVGTSLEPSYFVSPLEANFLRLVELAMRPSDDPKVLMIFPGDAVRTLAGGPARVIEMSRYLTSMGYAVVLIDLTDGIEGHDEVPPELADAFVARIGLPRPVADEFVHLALDYLLRDPAAETARDALGLALERTDERPQDVILARRDLRFNALAAFFASLARPEFIIAHFAWTAAVFDFLPTGICKILDMHDVQYRRGLIHQEITGETSYMTTPEVEMAELRKADYVLAIQDEDKELVILESARNNVILASHAKQVSPTPSVADDVHRMLFIGNRYPPNTFGLRNFFERSWAAIREAVPDAELWVVGSVGHDFTEVPDGVTVLGHVPDLDAVYDSVALVINPVEFGTGLNIKTVEAFCHGRCLVTTQFGLRGLSPDPESVRVALPETMHQDVAELLLSPEKRRAMEARAFGYAAATMTPEHVYRELFNTMELSLSF